MEGFMTTKEAAEKWNLSVRQVQNHCKLGRIKGVQSWNKLFDSQRRKETDLCLCV